MIKYTYGLNGIISLWRGNNQLNDKKDKHTGVGGRIMRIICPVLAVAAVAAVFIYSYITGEELTVANLVEHAPAQAGVAAAVMILIYIIKSLTVFFPVTVLYAAGGYIFGPVVGCAVNCAGIAAGCAVQYWMGKASWSGAAAKLAEKHPRISAVFTAQDRSPLFAALSANGLEAATPNARVSRASPARTAVDSPNFLWLVGFPRRRSSSSIQGRSS